MDGGLGGCSVEIELRLRENNYIVLILRFKNHLLPNCTSLS